MLVTKEALACSSRVSLGCLLSLSHPGSHEEISLVTNLDLSDTSGVTRCTQSTYLNGTSGSDSFPHRTEVAVKDQSVACSVRTFGQHLPTSLWALTILASTPDTYSSTPC